MTTQTTFAEIAAPLKTQIDTALEAAIDYNPDCPAQLAAAIRHSLLAPGKRLRPILVLLAAEACGKDAMEALPAACAVEMIHAYSLIHDDLPAMDDDDLRRGRPTCHAAFGEATAILAGDALLAGAFEVLSKGVQPAEIALKCVQELSKAAGATELVGGQAADLAAETENWHEETEDLEANFQKLKAIHRRKTGAMLLASLRLGGFIGGASPAELAVLENFGHNIGLAFQITDDILDADGDEDQMGKRVNKDDQRGKLTFTTLLGVEASRQMAKELIQSAAASLKNSSLQANRLEAVAQFVLERNS